MSNITEAQKKLIEDNHNLIYSFLRKHQLPKDEYYDLAAIGLCRAGLTYNKSKAHFSTYAYKCMSTYVFCEVRKLHKAKRIPQHMLLYYQDEIDRDENNKQSYDIYLQSDDNVEEEVLFKTLLSELVDKLSPRDRIIIYLLGQGYSHGCIAKKLKCSRSLISMVKRAFMRQLQEGE